MSRTHDFSFETETQTCTCPPANIEIKEPVVRSKKLVSPKVKNQVKKKDSSLHNDVPIDIKYDDFSVLREDLNSFKNFVSIVITYSPLQYMSTLFSIFQPVSNCWFNY